VRCGEPTPELLDRWKKDVLEAAEWAAWKQHISMSVAAIKELNNGKA
jgi:hypothetical protein